MRLLIRLTSALLFAFAALPALAHEGEEHHLEPSLVMTWWTFNPLIVAALAITALLYVVGLRRLWRSAGAGVSIRKWEAAAFAAGWLSLVIALLSPLHPLGEILFSAHMAQHEVLILVASPLLVLGRPFIAFLWALAPAQRDGVASIVQRRWFRSVWGFISAPFVVVVLHAIALWAWHIPALYEATLRSESIHALQHTSFLVTALLFWWAMVHGRYGRMGYGVAVLYVFATAMHSGILGALILFAPKLWYPIYASKTAAWGFSPLEDQQLAGLIMWIPAGIIFVVLALAIFAAWLGEAERRVQLADYARRDVK